MTATVTSTSPHAPDDVVAAVAAADVAEVRAAFARARAASAVWAAASAHERADALGRAADALSAAASEVSDLVVREVGKPVREAGAEVARGVSILRYHAQAALDADGETYPRLAPAPSATLVVARRRPRGVAGLITPWNFPVAIPLWKAAPALAYGNAVVLKPSPHALGVALRLAELLGGALPDGLLHVVAGGAEVGEALVAEADVVSFTGSNAVGGQVARAAAARGIPVQCEMGGCNASIVLPDVDPAATARVVAASAMGFAGQKCTATSRIVVVGDDGTFRDALREAVAALPVGDPADPATVVGPVIDLAARDRVVEAVAEAQAAGGTVLAGGVDTPGDGPWVAPTVVADVAPDARVAREEVFGPFAVLLDAPDVDAAIDLANGTRYGLVTSVFSRDLDHALHAVQRLRSGLLRINQPTSGVDFHAPFGGEAASSYGPREQGRHARELYTSWHTITVAPCMG